MVTGPAGVLPFAAFITDRGEPLALKTDELQEIKTEWEASPASCLLAVPNSNTKTAYKARFNQWE
jgi:hypothetical protein